MSHPLGSPYYYSAATRGTGTTGAATATAYDRHWPARQEIKKSMNEWKKCKETIYGFTYKRLPKDLAGRGNEMKRWQCFPANYNQCSMLTCRISVQSYTHTPWFQFTCWSQLARNLLFYLLSLKPFLHLYAFCSYRDDQVLGVGTRQSTSGSLTCMIWVEWVLNVISSDV